MSTGEKIWRAAEIAIHKKVPMILQAAGGGARMHAGCSSMVSIPKAQLAITRVEKAGLPVVTIITDPTEWLLDMVPGELDCLNPVREISGSPVNG